MSIRVAAIQLGIERDRLANLQHCVELIGRAAAEGAQVVVLPEFCNYPGFYASHQDAFEHAEAVDGEFVRGIAAAAGQRQLFVAIGLTVRARPPEVHNRQLLFSPAGELLCFHDKEVLFGQENDYLAVGAQPAPVAGTELGRFGLYASTDGLIPETTRVAALAGAQLLLCSLNSCSHDEAELHIPVRAAENHVWIAAADKAFYDVPGHGQVHGGRSEIVSPQGHVLARAGEGREEIIHADVDLALADDKATALGGHALRDRQPAAYELLALPVYNLPFYKERREGLLKTLPARFGVVQADTLAEAGRLAQDCGASIAVLPERLPGSQADLAAIADRCRSYVAAGLVEDGREVGLLVGPHGELVLRYEPVHPRPGSGQSAGTAFQVADTPFGRIGLMLGYDGLFPESARVLACMGADVIAYPTCWTEEWEPRLGVPERAAENHVSILAAARVDSPVHEGSLIIAAEKREPATAWSPVLNRFEPERAPAGRSHWLVAQADVSAARSKVIGHKTDILAQRRAEH